MHEALGGSGIAASRSQLRQLRTHTRVGGNVDIGGTSTLWSHDVEGMHGMDGGEMLSSTRHYKNTSALAVVQNKETPRCGIAASQSSPFTPEYPAAENASFTTADIISLRTSLNLPICNDRHPAARMQKRAHQG